MTRNTILSNSFTTETIGTPTTQIPVQPGPLDDTIVFTDEVAALDPPEDDDEDNEAFLEGEDIEDCLTLDDDPDTSLVGSIYLHLLSEHSCYEALRLSDDDAIALHQQMHKNHPQDHSIIDWRFRPGRALAASMYGCETPPTDTPA